jgi:hypothetical protein
MTLLNTFNGISNLGMKLRSQLDRNIEHVLRINHAGGKFIIMGGEGAGDISYTNANTTTNNAATSTAPIINHALWPRILERIYNKSGEILDSDSSEEHKQRKSPQLGCSIWFVTSGRCFWPIIVVHIVVKTKMMNLM